MGSLELVNVSKRFGEFIAVDNVSLKVEPGEFFVLLGPSGSGKTTLFRIIAGLIRETSGDVLIDGRNVTDIPPYKRNIGFVFQDRALFPHLSVLDNVAFGLRMQGLSKSDRYQKAMALLEMVHLSHYAHRPPRLLSGGEQQRIALIRALALNPVLLLLDEPLSSLDRKLRIEMRAEVKAIQQKVGITTIYVTHDQEEALTMADRVVIIRNGNVQQIGKPKEIYDFPQSKFVAEFIGDMNFFSVRIKRRKSANCFVQLQDIGIDCMIPSKGVRADDQSFLIGIRPERIDIESGDAENKNIQADVENVVYQGDIVNYSVLIRGTSKVVSVRHIRKTGDQIYATGERVYIKWQPDAVVPLID